MSKTYFLGKARTKARIDGKTCKVSKAIYEYLKDLPFTPAKVPMELNNWLGDYVLGLNHFNGFENLKRKAKGL